MRTDAARKSDLVDIAMCRHMITERAILVSDDGDQANARWLPLSECEVVMTDPARGFVTVTLPEWLAHEKGLI